VHSHSNLCYTVEGKNSVALKVSSNCFQKPLLHLAVTIFPFTHHDHHEKILETSSRRQQKVIKYLIRLDLVRCVSSQQFRLASIETPVVYLGRYWEGRVAESHPTWLYVIAVFLTDARSSLSSKCIFEIIIFQCTGKLHGVKDGLSFYVRRLSPETPHTWHLMVTLPPQSPSTGNYQRNERPRESSMSFTLATSSCKSYDNNGPSRYEDWKKPPRTRHMCLKLFEQIAMVHFLNAFGLPVEQPIPRVL
jgi:hypothetical protein